MVDSLSVCKQYLLLVSYLIPIFISLATILAIWREKNKSKSRIALMFLFGVGAAVPLIYMIEFLFINRHAAPILSFPVLTLGLTCAPILYIYMTSLLQPAKVTRNFILIRYIPFAIFLLVVLVLCLTGNPPTIYTSNADFYHDILQPDNIMRVSYVLIYVTLLMIYVVRSFIMLNKSRRNAVNDLSYIPNFKKYRFMDLGLLACMLFGLVPVILVFFDYAKFSVQLSHTTLITIAVLLMLFSGYYQPTIYKDDEDTDDKPVEVDEDQQGEKLKAQIIALFEQKKLHRSTDLTVQDLALEVNSNRTYISRLINQKFGVNFYTFVNRYRLDDFMLLVDDPRYTKLSIKEISERAGFGSYTTFFSCFKEKNGITPSEYAHQRMAQRPPQE